MAKGPCGPRGEGKQINILPAGVDKISEVTRSRKWGTGGKVTMSARCAKALIGAVPRRFFGSFLIAQKGTTPNKTRPTGEGRGNHLKRVQDGRRGKAQLCTKFFAKLSFKKAEAFLSTFFSEKSRRSRPGIGTRASKNTLRGATQFQNRATPFPLAPVLRQGGPHPSPGPLVAPSSSGPSP